MTWQETLREWGLRGPDAARVAKAQRLWEEGNVSVWSTPSAGSQVTFNCNRQRIEVEVPNAQRTMLGKCSCQDFRSRQVKTGTACKHLVTASMLFSMGPVAGGTKTASQTNAAPNRASVVSLAIGKAIAKKAALVQKLLNEGKSPLLWGTTGTGKTAAVHTAVLAMNGQAKPWQIQEAVGSESWLDADLIGSWTAERKWAWGPIGRAFESARGTDGLDGEFVVMFLDEITRFSPRALDILMRAVQPMSSAIARASGITDIPASVEQVYVIESPLMGFRAWCPADHLVWLAAGNPWVNPLDIALLRRFHPVEFGFDEAVADALGDPLLSKMVQGLWLDYENDGLPIPLEYQALAECVSPKQMFEDYLARLRCVDRITAEATRVLIRSTNSKWANAKRKS